MAINTHLQKELQELAVKDLRLTRALTQGGSSVTWDQIEEIRKHNTGRLKEIIEEHGWPDKSLVGSGFLREGGTRCAWYIAQHSDHDLDFQEFALDLMREALQDGEVEPADVAFLTDRVLVSQGKPQLYGSQFFKDEDGQMKPRPIEDPDNLEERRRRVHLEPFVEYKAKILGKE